MNVQCKVNSSDESKVPWGVTSSVKEYIVPIKDFDGYYISNIGKVYCDLGRGNRRTGRTVPRYEVKGRPSKNGYLRVYMRNSSNGKRTDRYIHRLVGEAFVPKPRSECTHINHKKQSSAG